MPHPSSYFREPPEITDATWYVTCKHLSWMDIEDVIRVERNNIALFTGIKTVSPRAQHDAAKMLQKCAKERMTREARGIRCEISDARKRLRRLSPRR